MEGVGCISCGRTYERCSQRVLNSSAGLACCTACKNTGTHKEREVKKEHTTTFSIAWAKVEPGDVVVRRQPHDGGPLKVIVRRKVDPFTAALSDAISGKENSLEVNLLSINPLTSAERVAELLRERGML